MDYEKKYKEALDVVKRLQKDWESTNNRAASEIAEAFSELQENEDEKICKELVEYLSNDLNNVKQLTPRTDTYEKWIIWLNKQCGWKNVFIKDVCEWLNKHVNIYVNGEYNEFHHTVDYDGTIDTKRLINDL